MSEPKVQLVDPQGNMSVTGMSAVGVITASSFEGVSNSSATGISGNPDLDVGIVTATSFVGQGKGHAAGLSGTPELNLGVTTATSFVGDATGKAAGLRGTPNLNVGLVTATSFVGFVTGDVTGNISGLAASITPGSNLGVGVCTAIQYHGDGSGLTGAASSSFIAQEITATAAETIIDLSDGNLIYYKGNFNTTVGFASTSAAEQITFIRDADPSYTISYSTGGVEFGGADDYLSVPTSSDFEFGTGDYTIEFWFYRTAAGQGNIYEGRDGGNTNRILFYVNSANQLSTYINASQNNGSTLTTGRWYHGALSRSSGTNRMFLDGVLQTSWSDTVDVDAPSSTLWIGLDDPGSNDFEGYLSNFRVIKGTALYTSDFLPPTSTITNITNTVLLCCQSDSSATAAAVIPTGSITATGSVTASAHTLTAAGNFNATITWPSRITWNNNTAPTLTYNSDASSSAAQIFNFTTVDTGLTYNGWEGTAYNEDAGYRLFYWGSNANGGAGQDNNTPGYSSPVQIPGTKWATVESLSGTSNWLGCIQREGNTRNTLWTWGFNSDGCLGQNETSTQYSSPTQVGTDNDWALFESNMKVGMATKTDGTLWMWGYNNTGNLGQGDKVYQSSPVQVPGTTWSTSGAQKLDTNNTTRAIKTDGTFWTWGWNNMGELAQNDRESRSSPVQVPGSWKSVSGTYYNSFGIRTDGTLWSWGHNSHGSLGQNNQTKYSSPNQIGTGADWSLLASTYIADFGGGIKTDGSLWLWGKNDKGTIGQSTGGGGGTASYSSPVQVPGTWQTCAFGDNHTMGLKTDGTMWVWGDGNHGTGVNNRTWYSSPVQVGTANDWTTGGAGQNNVYGTRLLT